ncbi:hypothetical protein AMECASPLE_007151, partial [Ameca splendens]
MCVCRCGGGEDARFRMCDCKECTYKREQMCILTHNDAEPLTGCDLVKTKEKGKAKKWTIKMLEMKNNRKRRNRKVESEGRNIDQKIGKREENRERCRCLEVLEKGQVQLIRLINWAVYEEAAPALRCLSVLPLWCLTSGSDRVEPSLELNLQADSSVSHQRSESCPPSQHLLSAPSQRTRRSKQATLSYTTGSMTIPPRRVSLHLPVSCTISSGAFSEVQFVTLLFSRSQTVPVLFPVPRIICLNKHSLISSVSGCSLHVGQ